MTESSWHGINEVAWCEAWILLCAGHP